MARGLALLVGLKSVDPTAYGGWDGKNGCYGCELDVDNMELLLSSADSYTINTLKTKQATASAILRGVESAASTLSSGDTFVFYYSGHGGQKPDLDGDESDDHQDETLVAYDRELIDDELAKLWPRFVQGVRIVMVSDSCNSGTNYRFMRTIDKSTPINFGQVPGMKAAMIHFSGCRDGGTSAGYQQGGAFTMALCEIWNSGNFFGTYQQLYEKIAERLRNAREEQEPQFNLVGNPLPDFLLSKPFSLLNKNIPSASVVANCLNQIPISALHKPSLAEQSGLRIEPFTAAVIGVAVGGALGLTSRVASVDKDDIAAFECTASVDEIRSKSIDILDRARSDDDFYHSLIAASKPESRIFGIDDAAASAFLTGVLVGAGVVKK